LHAEEDSVKATLENAKTKHASNVKNAAQILVKGIDERIKEAAVAGDLALVKELIAAKEEFQASELVPIHPRLTEDAVRYVGSRRSSASELYRAYQTAIRSYTTALKIKQATTIEAESTAFVDSEKKAITLTRPAGTISDLTGVKAKSGGTKELFENFYEQYSVMIDRIKEQPTTAKQEQMHRDLARKLDEKIKSQTWEFHCEIADVRKDFNGEFVLEVEEPVETPVFREEWRCRSSVANLRLSRQQGLDLTPGDVLVLRGTPRFAFEGYDRDTEFFTRHYVQIGDGAYEHTIRLTNYKFTIEKKKAAKED
jgi:hypothetical protein